MRGALCLGDNPDALRDSIANESADPRLSPIWADLSRAAPALITMAGFDPLRDQGTAYAVTLRLTGV